MQRYLEELVLTESPSLRDVRVDNVVEIQEGWERSLFTFDLSHRGLADSEALVARFYQGASGPRRAAWEADVLRAVAGAGVRVPTVEFVSGVGSEHGTAAVVMERLPGVPLSSMPAGSPQISAGMADALVALHQIPVEAIFGESLAPFDEPEFIAPDPEAMTSALDRYEMAEFEPLLERLRASEPARSLHCVLHNDFTPENILIDDNGDLTILDWSFAGVGDPRLDLAWSALWAGALAGNGARNEFLRAYEKASGEPIEGLEYFDSLRMGARLMTIAAWLDDAIEFPAIKVTKSVIFGDYRPTVLTVYERFREVTGLRLARFEQL